MIRDERHEVGVEKEMPIAEELTMSANEAKTIQVTCPCCEATLTIDPALGAVLDHKLRANPQMAVELKDAVKLVHEEASRRDEKYQKIAEAEKNKSKVLEAKFQELFKKAKEEPITKPLKDIDLD
jgi:hypothetical protein